jgi:hypothetical protein
MDAVAYNELIEGGMKMSEHATNLAYNWTGYQLGSNVKVSIGDVDGDNRLEVTATCCGDGGSPGTLYIFDWDGRAFVERTRISLGRISRILAIKSARLTGRAADDVIIATDNYFFIYQLHDNEMRRIFQSKYLGGQVVDVEIKDVTGDGRPELIIAIEGVGVQIYQWSGSQVLLIGEIRFNGQIRVAVGQTTGLGAAEIVILKLGRGVGRDVVEIFSMRNMQLKLIGTVQLQVTATGIIKTGRIGGHDREEIIVVTDGGRRVLIIGWQNNNFERIVISDNFSAPVREIAIGDWDNGRDNELILGLTNVIVILRLEGGVLTVVEIIETPHPLTGIRMADLNASGRHEIVIGTERGTVHFLRKIIEVIVQPRPPVIVRPITQPIIEPKAQFLVRERIDIPPNFPDIIKVAEVKARPVATSINVITNKVIVSGFFEVDILVVAEPDRRVLAFSTRVPFVHFVHIPGLFPKHRVKVEVEVVFVDFRFDPRDPRQVEVIIVAEIFVFDHIVRPGETIIILADKWQTEVDVIIDINGLVSQNLAPGQRLKMPFNH